MTNIIVQPLALTLTEHVVTTNKPRGNKKHRRGQLVNDVSQRGKFFDVRQRPWGRWAAEIWDKKLRKQVWLGTYNTLEEATTVYDRAAVRLKGLVDVINFPIMAASTKSATEIDVVQSGKDVALSLTSVICYEEFTPFDGLGADFGFELDSPLSLLVNGMSGTFYADEFGDLDFDDLIIELR